MVSLTRSKLLFYLVLLIPLMLVSGAVLADWKAAPGTVKVYVKKRVTIPAIGRQATSIPRSMLESREAIIVDERDTYLILQVPAGSAPGLRADLLPVADAVEVHDDYDVLDFQSSPVDARLPEEDYPSQWDRFTPASSPARDGFVVQFAAFPRPEWLANLRSTGATIIDYIPQNAYVVLASADKLTTFAAQNPVQLLRLHKPFHKASASARDAAGPYADIVVSLAKVPEAALARAYIEGHALSAIRPSEDAGDREFHRVTFPTAALPELAALPATIWIEIYSPATPSGEREAKLVTEENSQYSNVGNPPVLKPSTGDYRQWITNKGLNGYKLATRLAILDTGFDLGSSTDVHKDFRKASDGTSFVEAVRYTNDASFGNQDCGGHGTFVAGILAGNAGISGVTTTTRDNGSSHPGDADFLMGQGVVPEMPITVGRVFNYVTTSPPPQPQPPTFDPQPWTTIYSDLLNRGVGITSNSWNFAADTTYTTTAQTLDRIVRSANGVNLGPPMVVYFSAGNNEAPDFQPRVSSPATAKNVITAGGSENFNLNTYTVPPFNPQALNGVHSDNGNDMWKYSAQGPTTDPLDTRIKPDIVAPATAMESPRTRYIVPVGITCLAGQVGGLIGSEPVGEQHYWSRGTSFSAPAAAGNGALLYTWFKNKGTGAPKPSLLKAMQINFAYDLVGHVLVGDPPNETSVSLGRPPDSRQGWGKADLTRAFKSDGRYDWNNETSYTLMTSSGSSVYFPSILGRYRIKDTTRPVKITVVWTDQFASTLSGKALVNNLNLKVYMYGTGRYAIGNDFNASTGHSNIYSVGGTYNNRDNVEQAVFTYAEAGTDQFVVEVNGQSITGDAIDVWTAPPYTPQQDFAIFIDNVVGR